MGGFGRVISFSIGFTGLLGVGLGVGGGVGSLGGGVSGGGEGVGDFISSISGSGEGVSRKASFICSEYLFCLLADFLGTV